ncbi:MAG: MazG nucleotide pyrophosphohydrolase domain-containing protein [Acidimicrobiales bacterium]
MSQPTIRVVGLGPGERELATVRTLALIRDAAIVRLRTRVHPGARDMVDVISYDQWYEVADSFEELYQRIVEDLVALACAGDDEVLYVVPGSPNVAERTVELLLERSEVRVICEPAVSVIDVACARLGRDPMTAGLRIVDALASIEPFRGPGPLLVLQTYAPEVLASVADRLPRETVVTVLHHVGLDDEVVVSLEARELASFSEADHLTSLWIEGLRGAGEASEDLVSFTRRLRAECPWDQEQAHASLTRHLIEEAYEALDALENMVRLEESGELSDESIAHVEEELGDLLFQIVFHAELGDEEDRFNFATIADAVRDKLTYRHPHVFGDVSVRDAEDVASRWEVLKKKEKGRESVTDGIAWQLPSLALYEKLLGKARQVDRPTSSRDESYARIRVALDRLESTPETSEVEGSSSGVTAAWGDVLTSLIEAAQFSAVDLEAVVRERARGLRDEIRALEVRSEEERFTAE